MVSAIYIYIMELYHLRSFVTVAEEGRLTRAAQRLFTSQPAISAHIKALEEELGLRLFIRTPKGMELTAEGKSIKIRAEECLAGVDALLNESRRLKSEVMGRMNIGLNTEPEVLRTGELFAVMSASYPGLEFHLLQRNSWEILKDLRSGNLDAGYVFGEIPSQDIASIPLKNCYLCVVGPVKRQRELERAELAELASFPWVWVPTLCPFHDLVESLFQEQQLVPNKVAVADQEATLKNLVVSGVGLSFMIEDEALAEAQKDRLVIRRQERLPIRLFFCYLRKREQEPAIQAILRGISQVWRLKMEHDTV